MRAHSEGITVPLVCLLSNGDVVVVKYPRNPVGNQVLINEWIANKIANLMQVPIPDFGCCYIDNEVSYGSAFYGQLQTGELSFDDQNLGLSFFSKQVKKAVPMSTLFLPEMKNTNEFWNMLIFDYIIGNVDRHRGNLLYSIADSRFYAIDCSNILNSQRGWTEESLRKGIQQCDYKDIHFLDKDQNGEIYESFWPYARLNRVKLLQLGDEIQKTVTKEKVYQIINEIPNEWKRYITDDERKAVEDYINYRVDHINDICINIANERGII
ncbi:MAG: HipA family kinase [Enterocloster bolteae]